MRVLSLAIEGFRGINKARLTFPNQVALIGPNGAGKSTIVDALSLVFGRQKLVRELTEHDFTGSSPRPEHRIRIVATLGGFPKNDPVNYPQWFREGRAVEKWWDAATKKVVPVRGKDRELVVQIGYAARFDHEDLDVKYRRYFHDDDDIVDAFDEDNVVRLPDRLLSEIGYFVLPARRTWAGTISFGSEMFRKAVATLGGLPATSVLSHLERLRSPDPALEDDPKLKPLVDRINASMAQLIPGSPKLQLRVTDTDSHSFLRALVPHYERAGRASLPAGRHGTGLISLQTLVLLLEIGRARRAKGESFILALEEPELHVPPGLQRRLIGDAAAAADQVICTTHAPRVAAFFEASCIHLLVPGRPASGEPRLEARPLAPTSMVTDKNALIQLYTDQRTRLVEALMAPRVLVPEGRIDFEWLRLLVDVSETGTRTPTSPPTTIPPFAAVVGVVPTKDSHVTATYQRLRALHPGVFALVDGDSAGDGYVQNLIKCSPPPHAVVQWPPGAAVESILGWVVAADEAKLVAAINERLGTNFQAAADLVAALGSGNGKEGGLKQHYIAHEEIAGAIKGSATAVARADLLLEALTCCALGSVDPLTPLVSDDTSRSTKDCKVYRVSL